MDGAYGGLLAPPEDWPGVGGLPDVIPDWVLSDPCVASDLLLTFPCECCGRPRGEHSAGDCAPPEDGSWSGDDARPGRPSTVGWAIPGVTGLEAAQEMPPTPSREVQAVLEAVLRLERVEVTGLAGAQALVDAEVLLEAERRLRVLDLRRIGDVKARGLAVESGHSSTTSWLRRQRPDGDAGDAALAGKLRDYPALEAAVRDLSCSLVAARKVTGALRHCGRHLDRPDGLIDGQPGEAVLDAVIGHVATVLCRELQGLHADDPRRAVILAKGQELQQLRLSGASQAAVLEQTLTWLAQQVPPRSLTGLLDEVVMCVLPSELEEREKQGQAQRAFALTLKEDGSGWHACGDLTLECGERLWVALRAMAAGDPANPEDTKAWEAARAAGAVDADEVFGPLGQALAAQGQLLPRGRSARLHDALNLLLEKFLDAGLGGLLGKAPVQIHVMLSEQTVTSRPGAPPPRADSGRLIPRSVVRRWWCDSRVTAWVVGLGGKALRVVHAQRTHTADERRALALEGGGRCIGDGCCSGRPDPLRPLRPHHVLGFAEHQITSLEQTVLLCDVLHQDLHVGKRTVRVRDGRWLNENGWTTEPSLADHPPF